MSKSAEETIKTCIRDVKDFPKDGIVFKDITPVLQSPEINELVLNQLEQQAKSIKPDVIVGIDSRGFLYGNTLAMRLKVPFVLARKKGKLPYDRVSQTYELEYGTDEIEMHKDAVAPNQRILIHDDLLATGGTAACVAQLVQKLDGKVVGFSFVVNLKFLPGELELKKYSSNIFSVVSYD